MIKNISSNEVIELIAKYRIASTPANKLLDDLEYQTGAIEKDVFDMIYYELIGCSNGFLLELYLTLTGEKVEVIGYVQPLYACPCCGFKTLSEIYNVERGTGYDICRYCQWEDDGTTEVSKHSSVNRGSISDYRRRVLENRNLFHKDKWLR
ncbi:CPCC family cysteine-rich protein [Psychrobacter sp. SWN149]|uniref:CPCC family cysteine-rich protein n=1 Tax=Psychrobacter sp. SWN149 TaxID=2792057 RepID=UPI0018CE675B|nr:CPCC family cysteine-rich protein [Psychrobacter sp. SWN149]MBH0005974.1 hypothetical protein [Psychrobacter sp. SWN149]